MIFGIGTDLVEISRFGNINISGFARRVLSGLELESFALAKNKQLFLAKKFCAKEAVSKAFGVGIGKNLSFKDITILKNNIGKPICTVNPSISYNILGYKNSVVHVSISDSHSLIQAFAVVEV